MTSTSEQRVTIEVKLLAKTEENFTVLSVDTLARTTLAASLDSLGDWRRRNIGEMFDIRISSRLAESTKLLSSGEVTYGVPKNKYNRDING